MKFKIHTASEVKKSNLTRTLAHETRKNNQTVTMFAIVVFAIVMGVLAGCQKEDSDVCNFENPYDYVGEYHNEGLAYVLSKMDNPIRLKSSESIIEDQVYALTLDYCKQNPLLGYIASEEMYAGSIQSVKNVRLKSNQKFSSIQTRYQSKFNELIYNPKKCSSLADVFNQLKNIEREIYQSNMDVTDKEALLISYAVGRYSLEFWLSLKQVTIDEPKPRLKSDNENANSMDSFLNWYTTYVTPAISSIVESDYQGAAAGILGGLITGACVGSGVPGAGTITGAISCAVIGGAGGAIFGSAVGGAWYFFFN